MDEFENIDFLLNELQEMKDVFKNVPRTKIQKIIRKECKKECEDIKQLYNEEVAHLPRSDALKIEIVNLMLYLGINPFDSIKMKDVLKDSDDETSDDE